LCGGDFTCDIPSLRDVTHHRGRYLAESDINNVEWYIALASSPQIFRTCLFPSDATDATPRRMAHALGVANQTRPGGVVRVGVGVREA